MPKAAHSLPHAVHADDTPEARAARSGGTNPVKRAKGKLAKGTRSAGANERAAAILRVKEDSRPLLIGAGLGAAVALAVVALRTKERPPTLALFASPNSTFLSAVVKAAAFAIGRSAAQGSFASLVARAIGRAAAQ